MTSERLNLLVIVTGESGPVRVVRDRDFQYIHRYPFGPHELYNLREDSAEADRVAAMRQSLETFYVHYARPAYDGTRQPVTGCGQDEPSDPAGRGERLCIGRRSPPTVKARPSPGPASNCSNPDLAIIQGTVNEHGPFERLPQRRDPTPCPGRL